MKSRAEVNQALAAEQLEQWKRREITPQGMSGQALAMAADYRRKQVGMVFSRRLAIADHNDGALLSVVQELVKDVRELEGMLGG